MSRKRPKPHPIYDSTSYKDGYPDHRGDPHYRRPTLNFPVPNNFNLWNITSLQQIEKAGYWRIQDGVLNLSELHGVVEKLKFLFEMCQNTKPIYIWADDNSWNDAGEEIFLEDLINIGAKWVYGTIYSEIWDGINRYTPGIPEDMEYPTSSETLKMILTNPQYERWSQSINLI